jgi:hypothetical protein
MSTLLELCNEILRRTGQTEVTTLVNAQTPAVQTRDFINEIYTEMLQLLKVNRLAAKATLTTVPGTSKYALAASADVNSILTDSVLDTETQTLLLAVDYTYPLQHGTGAQGRPEAFYKEGDSIVLYPMPDKAYTLQYHYLAAPHPLTNDADVTLLPQAWEKVLIRGAQAMLESFLGDGGKESYFLYQEGLQHLKAEAKLKPQSRMRGFYRGWWPGQLPNG